jgi:ribosome-binding protein aMBF1 (putative translation factor)
MTKPDRKQPDVLIVRGGTSVFVGEAKIGEPFPQQEAEDIMKNYLGQIQQAVEASGVSQNQLARMTNMSQPTLSRFLKGETSMRFETVVLLLDRLGLEIRPKPSKGKKTKAAGTRAAKPNG